MDKCLGHARNLSQIPGQLANFRPDQGPGGILQVAADPASASQASAVRYLEYAMVKTARLRAGQTSAKPAKGRAGRLLQHAA